MFQVGDKVVPKSDAGFTFNEFAMKGFGTVIAVEVFSVRVRFDPAHFPSISRMRPVGMFDRAGWWYHQSELSLYAPRPETRRRRVKRVPFGPDNIPTGVFRVNSRGAALGLPGYTEGTLVSPHAKAIAAGNHLVSTKATRGYAMPFGPHPCHGNVKWRGVTFFADQVDLDQPLYREVRKSWDEYREGDRVFILNNGGDQGGILHCLVLPQVALMVRPPHRDNGSAIIRGLCDFSPRGRRIDTQIVSQSSFIWTDAPLMHPESADRSDTGIRLGRAA